LAEFFQQLSLIPSVYRRAKGQAKSKRWADQMNNMAYGMLMTGARILEENTGPGDTVAVSTLTRIAKKLHADEAASMPGVNPRRKRQWGSTPVGNDDVDDADDTEVTEASPDNEDSNG
jgi:hypothetical protein